MGVFDISAKQIVGKHVKYPVLSSNDSVSDNFSLRTNNDRIFEFGSVFSKLTPKLTNCTSILSKHIMK